MEQALGAASARLTDSLIEEAYGSGVIVASESPLRASVAMQASLLEANTYWGLMAAGADATVDAVLVRNTGTFGAALRLGTTVLECNRIDIDGENRDGLTFTFAATPHQQRHAVLDHRLAQG